MVLTVDEVLRDLGDGTIGLAHLENLFDVLPAPLAAKVRSAESVAFGQSPADFLRIHGDFLQLFDVWLVRIKNTCLSRRSHSSKSDLVSSLGLANGRALPMRSEFRHGLPCRCEFARVAAQIFSGTLNSVVGDRYA